MAPSPTIPTSFVPKQPVKSAARFTRSGGNIFLSFSLIALGLSIVGAVGVFGYGEYLKGVEKSKAAELDAAEASVTTEAVEDFIRSRDRFEAAAGMLDNHVALSNFFDLLEAVTLVNVRYSAFSFGTLEDGTAEIRLSGSARSFNALAAQSASFSKDKDIRRAIFSGIEVAENGTVSFDIDAQLDADLLAFAVDAPEPSSVQETTLPEPSVPDVVQPTPATTTAPEQSSAPSSAPITPPQL